MIGLLGQGFQSYHPRGRVQHRETNEVSGELDLRFGGFAGPAYPACRQGPGVAGDDDDINLTEERRQDKTRQDKTRQDKTRQDKTRQDKTRQDKTRQDKTRQEQSRAEKRREEKRRAENRTEQNRTGQNRTEEDDMWCIKRKMLEASVVKAVLLVSIVCMWTSAEGMAKGSGGPSGKTDDPEADFKKFDGNGDGTLSMEEYEKMLRSQVADDDGDESWKGFFVRSDTSGDGRLDFQEFSSAMISLMEQGSSCGAQETGGRGEEERREEAVSESDESVRYALQFDEDGNGKISFSEFKALMMEEGDTDDELMQAFSAWDKDKDGQLDFSELLLGLTGQSQEPSRVEASSIPEEFIHPPDREKILMDVK
eukprot:767962-Hanusia_phi.AAC.3